MEQSQSSAQKKAVQLCQQAQNMNITGLMASQSRSPLNALRQNTLTI